MKRRKRPSGAALTALLWMAVVAGLVMMGYPGFRDRSEEKKQLEILSEWSRQAEDTVQSASGAAPPKPAPVAEKPLPQWKLVDGQELLGSVRIDAIDLVEPIVRGATPEALLKGAGTVMEGRLPGQPGNFVLAGHRSWTKGRHFNRLGEVKPGDEVDIETTAGTYRYVVAQTKVVEPDDLSVLDQVQDQSMVTLITCTPLRKATQRLIVIAKLQDDSNGRSYS